MRVVIADGSLRNGRRLAGEIEKLVPDADVLLYSDRESAIAGVHEHQPDIVLTAQKLKDGDGPTLLRALRDLDNAPKLVGVVDKPNPDASVRYVDAGASVVLAKPVDTLGLRSALRHTAGGIPGS